jgi:hypothetical protein
MTPRIGKFDQSQIFQWSDGTNFNGAAIIGLTRPTADGTPQTAWINVNYGDTDENLPLPTSFALIPIQDGKLDDALGLFYNEDITPPNTQYVHYIIDSTMRIIAGPGNLFTVNSATVTLPLLTLNAPLTNGSIIPVPA